MKIYLAVIIAFSFLNVFNLRIIRGSLGSQIIPISSCVNLYTKEIKIQRIASYRTLENGPVNAVILITKNGVKVCVPRDRKWVKRVTDHLDQKGKSGKSTRPQNTTRA